MMRTMVVLLGLVVAGWPAASAAATRSHGATYAYREDSDDFAHGEPDQGSNLTPLEWCLAPICLGGCIVLLLYLQLRRELPALEVEPTPLTDQLAERLCAISLGRGLRDAIVEAKYELAGTTAGQAIATVGDDVLDLAASAVRRAVKSGEAASVIVRRSTDAVYAVALPVRDPRPQVVQRYLGATWLDHVASVQRTVAAPVLVLVVLCAPDAVEASLLVGMATGPGVPPRASDPEALLDVATARERAANQFRYVMSLSSSSAQEV